jgi:hypothetical protein
MGCKDRNVANGDWTCEWIISFHSTPLHQPVGFGGADSDF